MDLSINSFRILTCIDGSEESFRGLRYALRIGSGVDADITLLYVRAREAVMGAGGLDARVVNENLLLWDLELPGIKFLEQARDVLLEAGLLGDDWNTQVAYTERRGDPLGDNAVVYVSPAGKKVTLQLKVADDIVSGILEECGAGDYDLVILGASERWKRPPRGSDFWDPRIAEKVVAQAPCSVIVARELEESHGHLICTSGSEVSLEIARKDAILASRCACPISLLSVAPDEDARESAEEAIRRTVAAIEELGVTAVETMVRIGDPVQEIVKQGASYSVIVVGPSSHTGLRWLFETDLALQVVEAAQNSVMVVK